MNTVIKTLTSANYASATDWFKPSPFYITDRRPTHFSPYVQNTIESSTDNWVIASVNMQVTIFITPLQNDLQLPLLPDIISNLLDNRDFLGYQLSFCKGNLTESQFEEIKHEYLTSIKTYDVNNLAYYVLLLMKNTSIVFDADQISTMFKCDLDVAEEALAKIIDNRIDD